MKSNKLSAVDDRQPGLRLKRETHEIDPNLVIAQPTMLGAIRLCIAAAGFESEKELYAELKIDAGHWSRILRSEAHFPVDKLTTLMDLCGNEAPLIWLAHARHYDPSSLRLRESELEKKFRKSEERVAALRAVLLGENS